MSEQRASILVVEDDENLRVALCDNLEVEGYAVRAVSDGAAALEALSASGFDLVILDIMLPDIDGYTICQRLRAAGCEAMVLMLTARTLEDDLVRGFEAGADDYLAKPYRLAELLARVAALLRRHRPARGAASRFAGFAVDRAAREVRDPEGAPIHLTRTEFDLLVFLLDRRGRALTRDAILDAVWGEDVIVDTRTVDNFVSALKKKLGWHRGAGFCIRTVRGVGYRMEVEG